jgi:hypothetical protein
MKWNGLMRTGVAVVTLAILALTTFAPAAEAGHGHGRGRGNGNVRYKGRGNDTRVVYRQRVIHRSDSGLGPAIIGFIGGVAVGSAISNSHDRYYDRDDDRGYRDRDYRDRDYRDRDYGRDGCSAGRGGARVADYSYYDPYCDEPFDSFDACSAHERSSRHPLVIKVVIANTGQCVDTYRYQNGNWRDCD